MSCENFNDPMVVVKTTNIKLPNYTWHAPPETLTLAIDEVHVWRAGLELSESQVQTLQQTLSADELERAERFRFENHRKHFIVARGLLRNILGRYLEKDPKQLQFCYKRNGKPELSTLSVESVRFNISHSQVLALYAFTLDREIGIDLELIRQDLSDEKIAERFFSTCEVKRLRSLPKHLQKEAFFNCWTRKEAYIKARGDGLKLKLDQFSVSLDPGEPAELLSAQGGNQELSRWKLKELYPCRGFAGALAVEGHGWQLKLWQWVG